MNQVLLTIGRICTFSAAPNRLPANLQLLAIIIAVDLLFNILMSLQLPAALTVKSVLASVVQILLLVVLINALMRFRKFPNRVVQTLEALFGADLLFSAVVLVILLASSHFPAVLLFALPVGLWQLAVIGWILHKSAEFSFPVGTLVGFLISLVVGLVGVAIVGEPLFDSMRLATDQGGPAL